MNEQESQLLARRHLDRGYDLQCEGKIGYAIQEYRLSIALFPTVEAYTSLGSAFHLLGWMEEAIEACRAAIALDPDNGNPYRDIGIYLIELEQWKQAEPWLQLALSAPRADSRHLAHYHLGRIQQYLGRYDLARRAYRAALEANPTYRPAEEALAALLMLVN